MISYFNSGYLIRYPVAFFIACLVWIPSFISPDSYFEYNSLISLMDIEIAWIQAQSNIFIWIFFLLILLCGLAINQILRTYDLVNMDNTVGLVVFTLFVSVIPIFTTVNTFIIINFLLILFIQGILKLSVVEDPVSTLFNVSFYLGIASLFYTPLIYLLLLIWIAILINGLGDIRNFIISIAGLMLPFLLMFAWFYWNDSAIDIGQQILSMLIDMNLSLKFLLLSYFEMGLLLFALLIIIISVFIVLGWIGEKSNYTRKNIIIILYYMLLTLIIFLAFSSTTNHLLLFSVPATIIVSIAVFTLNKSRVMNILVSIFFISILLNHYYQVLHVKEFLFK